MKALGQKTWLIPDTFLNSVSKTTMPSHESICVLNTSDTDAVIKFTFYYEDAEPRCDFESFCAARRTHHVRMDKLVSKETGERVPMNVPYAVLVESNVEIVVQYSRLDTSAAEMALMTTLGYAVE